MRVAPLELCRRQFVIGTMAAFGILEDLVKGKHICAFGVFDGADTPPEPRASEKAKGALHRHVVVAAATPTQAAHLATSCKQALPVSAVVDRALIRVSQGTALGLHRQGADNKACNTRSRSARSRIAQPMTCQKIKSSTTLMYIQPACMHACGYT
ncbi:hypothetical protein GGR61_001170 [Xanthomonas arboricola]|nr:hypothetical protein [Xanthomonas sp. 3058]